MFEYMDFDKLKGPSNYSAWVLDAKSALILNDLWSVVESDAMPVEIPTSSTSQEDKLADTILPAVTAAEEVRCRKAWALINLIVEPAVRVHYYDISNPFKIWKKLEELFAARNSTTRHQTLRNLAALDSFKYGSLFDYTRELKRYKNRMINLDAIVPDWMYVSFFRLGLETKYQAVVYDVEQSVAAAGTEPDIDKLTNALVEYDRCMTHQG